MTAIACFIKGNDVILYADTLVSSNVSEFPRVPTPAHFDVNELLQQHNEKFRFVGHKQKLCILGRCIVIAFAGSESQAKDLAQTLLPYSDIPDSSIEYIDQVIRNMEPDRISDLSFIMVHQNFPDGFPVIDKECAVIRSFRWRGVNILESEKFDLILVGGSGAGELQSDFDNISLPINLGEQSSSEYESSVSVKIGHQLAHGIVLNEYFTGSNYASRYGGIVEVCDFFHVLPNKNITTVYMFFHVVLKDDTYILSAIDRMGVQYYKGEKLYHIVVDKKDKNNQRSDCIIADEIFDNVNRSYINNPSDETIYAIGIWVPFSGEKGRVHFILNNGEEGSGIFRVVKDNGEVQHGITMTLVEKLAGILSKQFDTSINPGVLRHTSWQQK